MNFEFPIEEISFSFETFGDANLNFRLNGREIGTTILGKDLEEDNSGKGPNSVTNNALFVGSTAELSKLLKQGFLNNSDETSK